MDFTDGFNSMFLNAATGAVVKEERKEEAPLIFHQQLFQEDSSEGGQNQYGAGGAAQQQGAPLLQSPVHQQQYHDGSFSSNSGQKSVQHQFTDDSFTTSGGQKRKATRVTKACDSCSKLKIKCNGLDPCECCIKRNKPCIFSLPSRKRGPNSVKKDTKGDASTVKKDTKGEASNVKKESSVLAKPVVLAAPVTSFPVVVPSSPVAGNEAANLPPHLLIQATASTTIPPPFDPQQFSSMLNTPLLYQPDNFNDFANYTRAGDDTLLNSMLYQPNPSLDHAKTNDFLESQSAIIRTDNFYPSFQIPETQWQDLINPRDRDPGSWSHLTFFLIRMLEPDGRVISFIDFFFKWCYPRIPVLSKTWMMSNLAQMPLYLLHTMYALCLCFPLEYKPAIMCGARHYAYARPLVLDAMDNNCDPFTILAFINMGYFNVQAGSFNLCVCDFSMATMLAQTMGLDRDMSLRWDSISGQTLGNDVGTGKNFLRSIWFLLVIYDYYVAHLFRLPIIIESEISSEILLSYTSPNKDDPSNISENYLSYYQFFIPLLALGRKMILLKEACNEVYNAAKKNLLLDFDVWYQQLPYSMKFHEFGEQWIGTQASYINSVYHASRLELLSRDFITISENKLRLRSTAMNDPVTLHCMTSANTITAITQVFFEHNRRFDHLTTFAEHCIFLAGLFHCVFCSISSDSTNLYRTLNVHIRALNQLSFVIPSALKDAAILSQCLSQPSKSLEILKKKI